MSTGQKILPEAALDHFRRGEIFGYIMANPGAHYNEIKQVLDIPNGSLSHHLRILGDKGYVKHLKDGKFCKFYPYDSKMPELRGLSSRQEKIVEAVNESPGCSQRDLAEAVGIPPAGISYSIRQLRKQGVVRVERDGIRNTVHPATAVA